MFFRFDPLYLLVVIVSIAISGAAQAYIVWTYRRWSRVRNARAITGAGVVEVLADFNAATASAGSAGRLQLANIGIVASPGTLSDHFDPRTNVVGLSADIANGASVASMAVAAHEMGHAQQHADRSPLMAARNLLVPAVSLSPTVAYLLIFVGLIIGATGLLGLGVLVFGLFVLFALLTIPIEVDASRRGLAMLAATGLLSSDVERRGAGRVLTAAALTYVAAAITAVLQLLYYLTLSRRRG